MSTLHLDALFSDLNGAPACVAAVSDRSGVIWQGAFGVSDLATAEPATMQTVFDIASCSKQFTAAAILLLAENGQLALDNDLALYMAEFSDAHLTVRHLMEQTSGLDDYTMPLILAGRAIHEQVGQADVIDWARRNPITTFQPGTQWQYSNTNYCLLAHVVELLSGLSFRAFADQFLFAPLSMTSSYIGDNALEVVDHAAAAYKVNDDGRTPTIDMWNWEMYGDGAMRSTAIDLLAWANNSVTHTVGGELFHQLQDRPLAAIPSGVMTLVHPSLYRHYAAGLFVGDLNGVATVCHPGDWGGFRSQFLRLPESGHAVAVLASGGEAFNAIDASVRIVEALGLIT
jgi:CubicO group peptidase (beta-lactamase class C family)